MLDKSTRYNNINDLLEDDISISKLATEATKKAFNSALKSGGTVLIAEKDALYECFPDGKRRFVRNINANKSSKVKFSGKTTFILNIK